MFARWCLCVFNVIIANFLDLMLFAKLLYLILVSFPYMSLITINHVGIMHSKYYIGPIGDLSLLSVDCHRRRRHTRTQFALSH